MMLQLRGHSRVTGLGRLNGTGLENLHASRERERCRLSADLLRLRLKEKGRLQKKARVRSVFRQLVPFLHADPPPIFFSNSLLLPTSCVLHPLSLIFFPICCLHLSVDGSASCRDQTAARFMKNRPGMNLWRNHQRYLIFRFCHSPPTSSRNAHAQLEGGALGPLLLPLR